MNSYVQQNFMTRKSVYCNLLVY